MRGATEALALALTRQVALDMDETLVCAYREANLPEGLRTAAAQHAAGAFRLPGKVTVPTLPFRPCSALAAGFKAHDPAALVPLVSRHSDGGCRR